MRRFTLILILAAASQFAFASVDGDIKISKENPTQTENTIDVDGNKACTGEYEEEDALGTYVEGETRMQLMELIPLTEDLEESSTSEFEENTKDALNQL